jgi:hypothetical protein
MLPSSRRSLPALALCLFGLLAGSAAPALANPFPGALYEAFGAGGLGTLDLADPGQALGFVGIAASNVVAGGGKVYFDSGATIYSANPDLSGLTNLHQNGAAPVGLALDAADGILYETFGADGVIALDLADPGRAIGLLGLDATSIVFGGGKVYLQSGNTIYSANADLSGLAALHTNGEAATGLALDPTDGILYETFGADGVTALDLADPGRAIGFLGLAATNIVYGGGTVYLQGGSTIYSTNADLAGLTTFHVNGEAPTGLAFLPPTPPAVPEPATLGLFGVELLAMVALRRRRLAGRRDDQRREGC